MGMTSESKRKPDFFWQVNGLLTTTGLIFGLIIGHQTGDWFGPVLMFGALGSAISTAV